MTAQTRTQLRRTLGLRTGQPFFRKITAGVGTASTNGTTTTLIDTTQLKEPDTYWKGSFIYFPVTSETREITAFTNSSSTVAWTAPLASSTTAGQAYEIWSQFTPDQVHEALNHALRRTWPFFFMTGTDESLVITDISGLMYTLPTTNTIRRLCQVYLKIYDGVTGTITTEGTTTQVIDSGASFVAGDVGKWISAYKDASTATGQIRQISAYTSSSQVTVSSAFAVALPVGAKYRMLSKTTIAPTQQAMTNYITDAPEFPTKLWFGSHPYGYEGYPLYLMYEYEYSDLSAEASTTTCPLEYLFSMAAAYLYFQKLASAPAAEKDTWEAMHKAAANIAEIYIRTHKMAHLPVHRLDHQAGLNSMPSNYPFR